MKRKSLDKAEDIAPNSKICRSCYDQATKNQLTAIDHNTPNLNIYREGHNSHNRCTFGCKETGILVSVPKNIRHSLLMEYKFLIVSDARMCMEHIEVNDYWPLVNQINQQVPDSRQKIVSDLMFEYYHEFPKNDKCLLNVDKMDSIDDMDFKAWIGFDKGQFNQICEYSEKCKRVQIAVFLCKLRTSLANQQLGFLFGVCERTIANYMNFVRDDLLQNFVPKFINSNSRETFVQHITKIARTLFDIPNDRGCAIFDATYRLCQKSKNFAGQKNMWSEQKKLPLMKPMVGCTPDGYILFVLGPYDATHNDATILRDCFERYEDQLSIMEKGDFVLMDRGFRDVLPYLTDTKGFKGYIPGLGKLETSQANMTRLITKIRWVIEQVFGRLKKKFKHFSIPAHNSTLENDYDSLLIAFALLNLFHEPIASDGDDENIAHLMLERFNVENKLKKIVDDNNLSRVTVPYIELQYTLVDNEENNALLRFPVMDLTDLYYIALGSYQIENARSYYSQHQKEGIFLVHKFEPPTRHPTARIKYNQYDIIVQDPLLVKGYMKSRYRGGVKHHIFVLVDRSQSGKECISEYYCTCDSGDRTVGCCSHVMTIIWYLGYAQYQNIQVPNPAACSASVTIPKATNSKNN